MEELFLDGDLNQMANQHKFLANRGIPLHRVNVYSVINGKENIKKAMQLILDMKVDGWWHYKTECIDYGVCTAEEWDTTWKNYKVGTYYTGQ